mgnify:CR=1 FL=1
MGMQPMQRFHLLTFARFHGCFIIKWSVNRKQPIEQGYLTRSSGTRCDKRTGYCAVFVQPLRRGEMTTCCGSNQCAVQSALRIQVFVLVFKRATVLQEKVQHMKVPCPCSRPVRTAIPWRAHEPYPLQHTEVALFSSHNTPLCVRRGAHGNGPPGPTDRGCRMRSPTGSTICPSHPVPSELSFPTGTSDAHVAHLCADQGGWEKIARWDP